MDVLGKLQGESRLAEVAYSAADAELYDRTRLSRRLAEAAGSCRLI
jgi:hypothetical protein